MITRYNDNKMGMIWSDGAKYDRWMLIEYEHLNTVLHANNIPMVINMHRLNRKDINEIHDIEKDTKHDIGAFVRWLSKGVFKEYSQYVHWGLTSSDVVDMGISLAMKRSNEHIDNIMSDLIIKIESIKPKGFIIGKTHGQPVEPILIKTKLDRWGSELFSRKNSLNNTYVPIKMGGVLGSRWESVDEVFRHTLGRFGNIGVKIDFATQIIPRQLYTDILYELVAISGVINKVAMGLRMLHRDGNLVKDEGVEYMGSSSIPSKSNPTDLEKINGIHNIMKGLFISHLSIDLLDERDISNSSIERVVFPDMYGYLSHMITTLTNAFGKYKFVPEDIKDFGFDPAKLNILTKRMSRDKAYKIVKNGMNTGISQSEFRKYYGADNEM